jgi:5-methylcytosine-specific restriction endonuclease McrA
VKKKREKCKKCGGANDGGHTTYCRLCYNAYKRATYQRDREKEIARSAAYNRANPKRVAANMRACRARRPEYYRQYNNRYRKENWERLSIHDANKRAKRRMAFIGSKGVSPDEWNEIKAKYRHRCAYCGCKKRLTMDHIVPIARGGKHEPQNIAPACRSCNSRKQHLLPHDFAKRIGRLI